MEDLGIHPAKISVIIVSYNCLDYLKRCIVSIHKYNDMGEAVEIIVVDNSTNDDTIGWLHDCCEGVVAIRNENKGFGQANNVGAAESSADTLLFLNPDTELIEPVFQFAVRQFENDKRLGLFGLRLTDSQGKRANSYGMRMNWGMVSTLFCRMLIALHIFIPQIMFTTGAGLFVRRKAFIDSGGFDENIFLYCEEADLSNRLNRAQWKNRYYRSKSIIHHEGKSTGKNFVVQQQREITSRKYYCIKYGIDFVKVAKKQLRYCKFKHWVLARAHNGLATDYEQIINVLESEIMGEKGVKK